MNKEIVNKMFFFVLFFVFSMCSDPELERPSNSANDSNQQNNLNQRIDSIDFHGSYLEFPNFKKVEETILMLQNGKAIEFKAWSKNVGFRSMHDVFEDALHEQENYLSNFGEQYRNIAITKIPKLQIDEIELIAANKSIFTFNESGLINGLNIFHPYYAYLVNKDGLLKVSGDIFQYNSGSIKIIEDGDEGKIRLLQSTDSTNYDLGIIVKPVVVIKKSESINGRVTYSNEISQGFVEMDDESHLLEFQNTGTTTISSYSTPIYGIGQCPCDGGPVSRTTQNEPIGCQCAVIIGYDNRTLYEVQQKVEKRFLIYWWNSYQPTNSAINVNWKINDISQASVTFATSDVSNTEGIVYDGPMTNITYGWNQFTYYYYSPYPNWASGWRYMVDSFQD